MADEPMLDERALDRKIDATGWGVFFVWVGVALIAHVGWGPGLLGVAVIMMGAQVVRKMLGMGVNGFSVLVGILFAIVGVWNIFQVRVDLIPLLFIVTGIAFILSMGRTPRARSWTGPRSPARSRV